MDVTGPDVEAPEEQVQAALERILATRHFAQTPRLSAFLRLVVAKALRGESGQIKEYLIGAEVYERDENYDPRVDSIVRVEATRLRARLRTYYETDGRNDALRIELPKGSYVPLFRIVLGTAPESVVDAPAAERAIQAPPWQVSRRTWLIGAGASAAVAAAAFVAGRRGAVAPRLPVALLMTAERAPRGGWSSEAEDLSQGLEKSLAGGGLPVLRSGSLLEMSAQAKARDASHYLLVLTGRCWEAPERLRVVMEMRRADTAEPLWSRAVADFATHRERLADAAAKELRDAVRRFAQTRKLSDEQRHAMDLHAQARRILHQGKDFLLQTGDEVHAPWPLAELLEVARLLERARLEDPALVAAHSGLAWVYRLAGEYDPRMYAKSKEVVEASLKLDPSSAEANFVKGYSAFFEEWDFVTAENCLRTDVGRSLLHLDAYRHYVDAALLTGHVDRAASVLATALSVLPRSLQLTYTSATLESVRRNYAEAERLARQTLADRPEMVPARCQLAVALARQKKHREAEDLARRVVADHPRDLRAAASLSRIYSFQGRKREALEAIRNSDLEKRAPATVGLIHAYCGEMDRAFLWLRQAVRQHDSGLPYTTLDPIFEHLKNDPRAGEIFRHLRLSV